MNNNMIPKIECPSTYIMYRDPNEKDTNFPAFTFWIVKDASLIESPMSFKKFFYAHPFKKGIVWKELFDKETISEE